MIQIMSVQMIEGGVGWGYSRKYQSSRSVVIIVDVSFHNCVEIMMLTTDDWVVWCALQTSSSPLETSHMEHVPHISYPPVKGSRVQQKYL